MSIYRKPNNELFRDPTAEALTPWEHRAAGDTASTTGEGGAREEAERQKRTKAEPLNTLLPRTRAWAGELPREVVPHELLRLYPRIANTLAGDWHEPDATRAYFGELLHSHRASRQGFSELINAELVRLRRYYYATLDAGSVGAWHGLHKP